MFLLLFLRSIEYARQSLIARVSSVRILLGENSLPFAIHKCYTNIVTSI